MSRNVRGRVARLERAGEFDPGDGSLRPPPGFWDWLSGCGGPADVAGEVEEFVSAAVRVFGEGEERSPEPDSLDGIDLVEGVVRLTVAGATP